MRTRWPLTVMLLRNASYDSQTAREYWTWLDRTIWYVREGRVDLVRPHWETMLNGIWLRWDDPT